MDSILIKDTTREERERIVAESIGSIDGSWAVLSGLAIQVLTFRRSAF